MSTSHRQMVQFKLSISLAITALFASSVSALTLQAPVEKHFGAITTISWTVGPYDPPTWDLYLSRDNEIWAYYGTLAESVNPSTGIASITIPTGLEPRSDYVVKAVWVDNFDRVITQSPAFSLSA